MNTKHIRRKLISMLLAALLVLGAVPQTALPVYAADSSDPYTNVGNETALRTAIGANQNIKLTADITVAARLDVSSYRGTVDGSGRFKISAGGAFNEGIFLGGTSTDLTLKDITVDGGGLTRAFFSSSAGKLTLSGATVQNCAPETGLAADGMGAAIYIYGSAASKGKLDITNSNILNNHTSADAQSSANGGAVYAYNCDIVISGSSFEGNHCKTKTGGNSGGAVWMEGGSLSITGSTFKTGKGFNMGGSLYVGNVPNAVITESEFLFDSLGRDAGVSGGCIAVTGSTKISITDTAFSAHNSSVTFVGGMIDVYNDSTKASEIVIDGCSFTRISDTADNWGNKNSDWNAYAGGAIAYESGLTNITIKNSSFTGCQAQGNVQGPSGGGAIAFGPRVGTTGGKAVALIEGCTFSGCWTSIISGSAAGAIMINSGNEVTIKDSSFVKGSLQTGGGATAYYGGAIWNAGDTTLENVKIQNLGAYLNGGGIYNAEGGDMLIRGSESLITGCKAGDGNNTNTNYGGGIYNAGTLEISGGQIKANTAGNADRNRQDANEYSGSNIYAAADITIGPGAVFDAKDVRVLDGVSSIILSGAPSGTVNVSISENAKETDANHIEGMYRYIGYLVAKGDGSYSPTASDLAKLRYLSRDADASADPEAFGKWVFVFDPVSKTIVVGQNVKFTYDPNEENFSDTDAAFAAGITGTNPGGDGDYGTGLYGGSAGEVVQKVSVYSGVQKFPRISQTPAWPGGSSVQNGTFYDWLKAAPSKDDMKQLAAGGISTVALFDFDQTIVNASENNADGKITGLLENGDARAYAGYLPYELSYGKGAVPSASGMPTSPEYHFGGESVTISSTAPSSSKQFREWKVTADDSRAIYGDSYAAGGSFTMPANDAELTAQWSDYTVTYEIPIPQGASAADLSGAPSPLEYKYAQGDAVNVAAAPSLTGYSFRGWKVTADASDTLNGNVYGDPQALAPSASFTMPAGSVTLTAQWEINKHDITYTYTGTVPAGAPAASDNDLSGQEYKSAQSVAAAPSLSGWTFSRWTASGLPAGSPAADGSFTMPDNDVIFVGTWSIDSYKVHYAVNAPARAQVQNVPVTPQEYDFSELVQVDVFPTREGVTFLGWEVTVDESGDLLGTIFEEGSNITGFEMPANDVTLTGRWQVNTHDVTWIDGAPAGAAVTGMPDPASESFEYGVGVDMPAAPELEGYTFIGWEITDDASGGVGRLYEAGVPDAFDMPDNDVELTAQWEVNTHSVIYEYTGEVPAGAPAPPLIPLPMAYGSLQTRAGAPSMEGHTFYGWSVSGLDESDIAADGSFKMPDNDVVFTGSWDVQSFSIRYAYESEAPDGAPEPPQSRAAAFGSEQELEGEPELEGYSFSGWTPAEGLDASDISADGSFTMPAGDVLFTGSWAANEYTVEYLANEPDGFTAEGMPAETLQSYEYGENVAAEDGPSIEGYIFTGWKVTADGTGGKLFMGKVFSPGAGFSMPAGDLELSAQWTAGDDQLRYEPNPEKGRESRVRGTMQPTIGSTYSVATVSAIRFEYEGHIFTGWNTEADGSGDAYEEGGLYVLTAGDDVLYAQWDPESYTVSYVFEGTLPPDADELLPDDREYDYGVKVRVEAAPKTSGYSFSGWTLAEGGAKPEVISGSFEMPAGDVVFTGKWTKDAEPAPAPKPGKLDNERHYAYITGYPDGTVRPQEIITRAEVATIFFRLLKDNIRDANLTRENSFSDVPGDAWYAAAVSTLAKLGVIRGYDVGGESSFRPDEPITRAEFVAMAGRFDENGWRADAPFTDTAEHWAFSDISKAAENGWINGYADGSFKPDSKITRAETMAIVNRVLGRQPKRAEDLHKSMTVWPDNADTSAWYYLDVQEATNSHEYSISSVSEKWIRMRSDPDWSRYE